MRWQKKKELVVDLGTSFKVAVSLGKVGGSVLLVGSSDASKSMKPSRTEEHEEKEETNFHCDVRGLVQLRVHQPVHVQETSCFVLDDEEDEEETEMEISELSKTPSPTAAIKKEEQDNEDLKCKRRMPATPREKEASSSGSRSVHRFGEKIKMIKRSWSMTKGSLGRIRPKVSVILEAADNIGRKTDQHLNSNLHLKQFFTWKKRSRIPSFSSFYLKENEAKADDLADCEKSHDRVERVQEEQVYSNETDLCGTASDCRQSQSDGSLKSWHSDQDNSLYQLYYSSANADPLQSEQEMLEKLSLNDPEHLLHPTSSSLWCRRPQVIKSGLLEKLSPAEKTVQEVKFELLTSELRYLHSLRVLDNEFAKDHELVYEILAPGEKERLFGGVASVLQASLAFLRDLENLCNNDLMLDDMPDVILEHTDNFMRVFGAYCSSQVYIEHTLKELKARKNKFVETVNKIERRPACQHLPITSFLMLPMQRITRLPLLADAVLSKLPLNHKQRSRWEKACASLSNIASECNERARASMQTMELQNLQKKLVYPPEIMPIQLGGDRKLMKSGPVVEFTFKASSSLSGSGSYKTTFGKKYHKSPLYLIVLTDYVLVTKPVSNGSQEEKKYMVLDSCKKNLVTLEPMDDDSASFTKGHAVMILTLISNSVGRLKEFTLGFPSDTDKERWIDAVSPPRKSASFSFSANDDDDDVNNREQQQQETLYELWDCPQVIALFDFFPTQPDEISLRVGDVVNVLRKSNRNDWYQGEKLLDRERGWFPASYTREIVNQHVRARNLVQRHRLLLLSEKIIQKQKSLAK